MKQSEYDCKNKNQAGRVVKNFLGLIVGYGGKSFAITAVSTHAIVNFSEIARTARGEIIYFVNCEI